MSGSRILNRLQMAACAALPTAALAVHDSTFGSLTAVVNGRSMCPTFNDRGGNDRIILNRFCTEVERGDVVVLRSPAQETQLLIKRVIGLEGDRMVSASGEDLVVPAGHYWVEGDNKPCSQDSRHFGSVERAQIEARVALKVWPLTEACVVGREIDDPAARRRLRHTVTRSLSFA